MNTIARHINNASPHLAEYWTDLASDEIESITVLRVFVALWVRLGVLEFSNSVDVEDSTLAYLLRKDILEMSEELSGYTPSWNEHHSIMNALLESIQEKKEVLPLHRYSKRSSLARFLADYSGSVPGLFALCLAGEMHSTGVLGLVPGCLRGGKNQQELGGQTLDINLLASILKILFGLTHTQINELLYSRVLNNSLLSVASEGILATRRLELNPLLWAAICGRDTCWPNTVILKEQCEHALSGKDASEIPMLTSLFNAVGEVAVKGLVLRGYPNSGRRDFVEKLADRLGLQALIVPVNEYCQSSQLQVYCHYANYLPVLEPDLAPGEVCRLPAFVTKHPVVIILGSSGAVEGKDLIELELTLPAEAQRKTLYASILDDEALASTLASYSLLSGKSINFIAKTAKVLASKDGQTVTSKHITSARELLGAEKLGLLAQPVKRAISRDALIVPRHVQMALDNIIVRARKRESLWRGLGNTMKVSSNSGIRALFVGESGTGKSLAASYIATELMSPLYRVDLSAVMNKYIGESEKNLAQLLEYAAASDVVLVIDEADSLFGSRTDGSETGERFANMLTNFLLTRIETYSGVVILTTNSRERIDDAFSRRIDTVVDFPLPSFEERKHLWLSHFGECGPGREIYEVLAANCLFSGGQIRNAVITAAVFSEGDKISCGQLFTGLQLEYQKLGRDMPQKIQRLLVDESSNSSPGWERDNGRVR